MTEGELVKDYYHRSKHCIALGTITLKTFQTIYETMSESSDKLPTASNCFPLFTEQGNTLVNHNGEPLYDCVIYYDTLV